MNKIKHEEYYKRLQARRNEIIMTLEHISKEQRAVDENKDWIDRAAYASRVHLLDNLADWYANETARIDQALLRIAHDKYGTCLGCKEPIDPRRLTSTPEAIFCSACQAARESLSASSGPAR